MIGQALIIVGIFAFLALVVGIVWAFVQRIPEAESDPTMRRVAQKHDLARRTRGDA